MRKKKAMVKTLQTTNVPIRVLENADERARNIGFGSVQDVVRLFLNRFSKGEIDFDIGLVEHLPPHIEARYEREASEALKELKKGERKAYTDAESMIRDLMNEE